MAKTFLKNLNKIALTTALTSSLLVTGCATSELLSSNSHVSTNTVEQTLVEDQVVAFGKPTTKLPNMPANSVVIVGEKNSYVLSEGGLDLVNLLSTLDAKSISVDKALKFYSPKNDGYFSGTMKLSYAKLKDEFKRSDLQFFLQEDGKECSTASDKRIGAQRFCFSIPIKGGVFPQVSNLRLLQSKFQTLTKPYSVSIYTTSTSQKVVKKEGTNAAQKLVLLPFALAFDVITLPLQILD
ncbi:hypothetical protein VH441_07065 [Psychrobacter sp. HD31]|uniref:hypothetical protein n=1 Tax=Psychrobacter sp. HD31 TaxID=3112003 RepID=UPI003DA680AA